MIKKISICMIVKDEEKNLRRCLYSLLPLIQKDYAELIIVDTGSTDHTVDIAKEFTSKVYYHQWNNSFSDMRNISISYAKGEWILIIDADEEMANVNSLIEMFEKGTFNKYCTIQFNVKNKLYTNNEKFIYHISERMFINDGEFRYNGTVHNQPVCKPPVYFADITLNHYGYINDDEKLMEKKFQRTAGMLQDELKKNPDHIYYRFQLARSYFMHKDYYDAYEQIKLAYNTVTRLYKEVPNQYYYVFIDYARISFVVRKFEETLLAATEGMKLNDNYIDFYFYLGYASFSLKDDSTGDIALEKYFDLYKKYKNHELDFSSQTTVELYSVDDITKSEAAYKYVSHLISIGEFKKAERYFDFIDNEKYKFESLIKIKIGTKEYTDLFNYYAQLNGSSKYTLINVLEDLRKQYSDDVGIAISSAFSVDENDPYCVANKVRLTENKVLGIRKFLSVAGVGDSELPFGLFSEFFGELLLGDGYIFHQEIKNCDAQDIRRIVVALLQNEDACFKTKLTDLVLSNNSGSASIDLQKAKYIVASVLLFEGDLYKEVTEESIKIFNSFVHYGKEYVVGVYQSEKIRIIYKTLSKESFEKFFMLMLLFDQTKDVNKRAALRYYKEATQLYPYFSKLLSPMVNELKVQLHIEEIVGSFKEITNNPELKVLHGTLEIANQMNTLVKGLNELSDVKAYQLNYYPSYLGYNSSSIVDMSTVRDEATAREKIYDVASQTFDIFHYHYNTSLLPNLLDIKLLKERNKKVFMHHWGSEIRRLSLAKKLNPYAKAKFHDEDRVIKDLQYLGNYIDDCIVADAELYEYVKVFYNRVHFVRQAIDLSIYAPNPEFKFREKKPVIVHAPTASDFKGTKFVNAAIEDLRTKYDIEYRLVQNTSHEEAKKIYRDADIIVDQLHGGAYGLFALEAMAMGKPVICHISDFMISNYPKDLPIFTANPDNIKTRLGELIKDNDLRIDLGTKGRVYVEQYHDHLKIAKQLYNIYRS